MSSGRPARFEERYAYAFADGTYFTVIYNGEGCKMPILAVSGHCRTGKEKCSLSASAIEKMSRLGKTCWKTSKQRGVKDD